MSQESSSSEIIRPQIHRSYLKMKPHRAPANFDQEGAIKRGSHYWVENSLMSPYMICQEVGGEQVSCVIGEKTPEVKFEIQDFSEFEEIDEGHMTALFEEKDFDKVTDEQILGVLQVSIEKALKDYDSYVFACDLTKGQSPEAKKSFYEKFPEIFQQMKTYKIVIEEEQEYDSFNIENFYTFCHKNPKDPED